jgi:hypothetical protein
MGALALRLRDFPRAERAYRAAVSLAPESYDAHLGLAEALRGQLLPDYPPEKVETMKAELQRCEELAPARPETAFNELWFFVPIGVRGLSDLQAKLEDANARFREAGDPWYAEAARVVQDWLDDSSFKFIRRTPVPPRLLGQCPGGRL